MENHTCMYVCMCVCVLCMHMSDEWCIMGSTCMQACMWTDEQVAPCIHACEAMHACAYVRMQHAELAICRYVYMRAYMHVKRWMHDGLGFRI
jgi:hypothetical protein